MNKKIIDILSWINDRLEITANKMQEYKGNVESLYEWYEGQHVVYQEMKQLIEEV